VYVHAITSGRTEHPTVSGVESLRRNAQHVVLDALWRKSDLKLSDFDLFFAYDGFTVITLNWIENAGWCAPGEAGDFLRQHWNEEESAVWIDGRIPINTHGGNLSEGATQGAGHVREAVVQLRGDAGERQVPGGPANALLLLGGMYMNAIGTVLRTERR
jgi:acetyl-CoA acetyltransferase